MPARPSLIDQMMAAREQRRAQEAARQAELTQANERLEAEARAIAEMRRKLDTERAARDATRARLEAEAAELLAENEQLIEVQRREQEERLRVAEENRRMDEEVAVERQRLEAEAAARKVAREQIEAEERRLAAEKESLAEMVARLAERERALQRAEQEVEENRRRDAVERAERERIQRIEMEEIDRRLEARANKAAETAALAAAAASTATSSYEGTRRKARLRVEASVLLDNGGQLIALTLVNVSLTGGLISTEGHDLSHLALRSIVSLTLVANDDAKQQVDLDARVVRHGDKSLAVDWSEDRDAAHGIAQLLDELSVAPEDRNATIEARRLEIEEIDERLQALEPSPPAIEPRRKPRLQLSASMLIDHDGGQVALPLVNVSLTGGLILHQSTTLAGRRVGALLLMALVATSDEERRVDLLARVVRHDGDTTAVDWSQDEAAAYDVAKLLDELAADR